MCIYPRIVHIYSKSFENLERAVDILIICGPAPGGYFGYFARIIKAAKI